jgi:hypothetical protein
MMGKDKRKDNRFTYDMPESIYCELKVDKRPSEDKVFDLYVKDCSRRGLGMLVTEKDLDLLNLVNKGDRLDDIAFFSTWSVFRIGGRVTHMTQVEDGRYKGCYIMGVSSDQVIGDCPPG